ncbi:MAG: hypothetical protein EBQ75_01860 [Actinobacteria bacterium]|nr:hypothetical protein [Actinomycetota bacterium]
MRQERGEVSAESVIIVPVVFFVLLLGVQATTLSMQPTLRLLPRHKERRQQPQVVQVNLMVNGWRRFPLPNSAEV